MNLTHRLAQMVTSDAPPAREAIQPVPEAVRMDDMNPYRGIDPHGVERVAIPHPVPNVDATTTLHYDKPKPDVDPIPVRIVTEAGRELRDWFVAIEYAGVAARQIVPRNMDRSQVILTNNGTQTIWLGRNVNVAVNAGYPLGIGKEVTWNIQTAVFAVSNDGSQQQILVTSLVAVPL